MKTGELIMDCSAFVDCLYTPAKTAYIRHVDAALDHNTIIVPSLFLYEITNVLLTFLRRGMMPQAQMQYELSRIQMLPHVIVEMRDMSTIGALARKYNLTGYDASYLALALQYQAPLATIDKALKNAAIAEKLFYYPVA